ncbi:MAG: aroB [Myxococcales bacterium]|nr:aroB [Myxococcales bacterium]
MSTRVDVGIANDPADRSYPIFVDGEPDAEERFAAELCTRLPAGRIGIVTDETVSRLHLGRYADALRARNRRLTAAVVPDGEGSKSMARAEELCESFAREGLDRGAVIVALGGGVVGDLAGFVASIFLRGVSYVQVPTTLLAQVDSSVGGKTGVNLPAGKNLVGAFWQPKLVYADVTSLATLSERDRVAGLAEVIKHAFIADVELLARLEDCADRACAGDPKLLEELVAWSCEIKARVVGTDERETTGARALLNFGHTIGHALESASHKMPEPLRHGEAVGLGMLAAARVNRALGGVDLEPRLRALLSAVRLPVDLDPRLSHEVLARVAVDKKRGGETLGFIVVDEPGSARVVALAPSRISEILLGIKSR